jgi:hypothetical protein
MPILGNLSEFPLPEVLLLIGTRTGRLRLLDVPEVGMMEIDFSNGEAQMMYLGNQKLTESEEMIAKLSAIVKAQGGMFEFRLQPVASITRAQPLMVNQMVISLVCQVDEEIARERIVASPEHRYVLQVPEPEIWIEPELNDFLMAARLYLTPPGIHLDELAYHLEMDVDTIHKHLTNLRLLGVVNLINPSDLAPIEALAVEEEVTRKSNEFLRASRVSGEIQRKTGNLR